MERMAPPANPRTGGEPALHLRDEAGVVLSQPPVVDAPAAGQEVVGELRGLEVGRVDPEVLPPREAGPGRVLDAFHLWPALGLVALQRVAQRGLGRDRPRQGERALHGHPRSALVFGTLRPAAAERRAFLDTNARLRAPADRFYSSIAAEKTIVDSGDRTAVAARHGGGCQAGDQWLLSPPAKLRKR
jgi:hypothetical protein